MKTIRKFFASLRILKRLRAIEEINAMQDDRLYESDINHSKVAMYFETREPCDICGSHRYRQKTLHRGESG